MSEARYNIRDEAVIGQHVVLEVQFYSAAGDKSDADEIPTIQISNSDGDIILEATDEDVMRIGPGLYQYVYVVPEDGPDGTYIDSWDAVIDEADFNATFSFEVVEPSVVLTADTGPARIILGDDVVFDWSDAEILGINTLLKSLKARLRSTGLKPVRDSFGAIEFDAYGEMVMVECDLFSDEILIIYLQEALSEFNMVPFFTSYNFADPIVYQLFASAIVEIAYIYAIASQSLLERGRDFTISDSGTSYIPPQLGDFLASHYSVWLTSSRERLKFIKNSIRPGPMGINSFTSLNSGSPAVNRLRHLRARRII